MILNPGERGEHLVELRGLKWRCEECAAAGVLSCAAWETVLDLDRRLNEEHEKYSPHCPRLRLRCEWDKLPVFERVKGA